MGRFLTTYSISLNAHRADVGNLCHLYFVTSLARGYPFYLSFLLVSLCFFSIGFSPSYTIDFYSHLFYFFLFPYFGFKFLKMDITDLSPFLLV